jgi:hypothetical protein
MFHGYFDADLWKIFAELSYFYRQICAKQVSQAMMQKLEKEITVLICKMEKIFPPGWFNAMQYLLVHSPWEAKVGGLAQFRSMYSQERELKNLELQCATRQGLRVVLRRHSCVKRLRTSQASISHAPTM